MFRFEKNLDKCIKKTERKIRRRLEGMGYNIINIFHYGAIDIDPRHLVIWIIVSKDITKNELNDKKALFTEFREELCNNGYPREVIEKIYLQTESQETIDREANGSWWEYFK